MAESAFEKARDSAVADLREVARIISQEADEIAGGDLGRMDALLDDSLFQWRQILILRHEHRMTELDEARKVVPVL